MRHRELWKIYSKLCGIVVPSRTSETRQEALQEQFQGASHAITSCTFVCAMGEQHTSDFIHGALRELTFPHEQTVEGSKMLVDWHSNHIPSTDPGKVAEWHAREEARREALAREEGWCSDDATITSSSAGDDARPLHLVHMVDNCR